MPFDEASREEARLLLRDWFGAEYALIVEFGDPPLTEEQAIDALRQRALVRARRLGVQLEECN